LCVRDGKDLLKLGTMAHILYTFMNEISHGDVIFYHTLNCNLDQTINLPLHLHLNPADRVRLI
jgi:hypothetical protein